MTRIRNTNKSGGSFDDRTIRSVWVKGITTANPNIRLDKCGAKMQFDKYGKTEDLGWEIDHIKPVAKGGSDDLYNLQPLQWDNNRKKGDDYPDATCAVTN